MKRRNFLKAFAAACAVPAVAAKAIAATQEKPTDAEIDAYLRDMFRASDEYGSWYDQSGNGNHAFLKPPLVEQMWGPPAETYNSAFGDVKIYKHPSSQKYHH